MKIIYIVPAWSNQGGQCRIVSCDFNGSKMVPAYRDNPQAWKEVGLMNSRGKLVCFEGADVQRQEIRECEPLMAGMTFVFDAETSAV